MLFRPLILSALACVAFAAVNEPCYSDSGAAGVCMDATQCSQGGGTAIAGACPADAANVKCCTKPSCSAGACRWNSDCSGSAVTGQCPGPSAFQCCGSNQFGGYSAPSIPAVGTCQASAVSGAKALVAAWPGRVRQVYCIRDCACGSGSDHCCGKAIDFMCSDGGGVATLSGRQLAEWAMNNAAAQNIKYVIWGQRIWNPSQDGVKAWSSWRTMEDRGSITENHWDHVHVSYN